MRQSTADRIPAYYRTWPRRSPPLAHPPARAGERSTTFAHRSTSGRDRPAPRRMPATRSAAWPRRSHRRSHRRTAPPLHHRSRARRRPVHRLQDPPRVPVPTVRRGLPGRHLPAHPCRTDRRQGHPGLRGQASVRLHHPDRTLIRPRPRPPGTRRQGTGVPSTPKRRGLSSWRPHVLHAEARPRRRPARRTAVRGLLRLHRFGPVQRLRPGTVAALHHHPAPDPRPPGRAYRQGLHRPGPALLREGR